MKEKKEIRKLITDFRDKLTLEEKKTKDEIIYSKIITSETYKLSNIIFVYVSYKNEVDTHNIINHALKEGKSVLVPKVISLKEGMSAVKISSIEKLKPSSMGILEPDISEDKVVNPEEIDMVILPGVAFDLKGGRLGYGGGFYDRFLRQLKPYTPKIAVAYSFQVLSEVPMWDKDVYIDEVITE